MEVSIIIVSYNTKELTLDCIDSILLSKPKSTFEIIIVDNGSSDGSYEVISKLAKKDSRFQIVRNEENLGFAKANNQGIASASGKYILLLNSDTKVQKNAIDSLLEFAKVTNNVGAVVSRLLNPDGSIQPSCFRLPSLGLAVKQYWFGKKGLLDKYAPLGTEPTRIEVAVMASFLITPQALKQVGMLDERFFMYMEDFEYCRRLIKAGFDVYYLPKSQVIHQHGASGKHLADAANQWKRLIPSNKLYHGLIKHYILLFIMWTSQKLGLT